ncbi:hypothetical protein [Neptuniibacter sp.]|uniref:hypothetical protein n=1 Tax=Neptuniibacter sp. TaxID=1962643 RepID=UPI003B598E4E
MNNQEIESVVVKLMDLEQSIDGKQAVDIKQRLVDIQLMLCEIMVAPLPRSSAFVFDNGSVAPSLHANYQRMQGTLDSGVA